MVKNRSWCFSVYLKLVPITPPTFLFEFYQKLSTWITVTIWSLHVQTSLVISQACILFSRCSVIGKFGRALGLDKKYQRCPCQPNILQSVTCQTGIGNACVSLFHAHVSIFPCASVLRQGEMMTGSLSDSRNPQAAECRDKAGRVICLLSCWGLKCGAGGRDRQTDRQTETDTQTD